jgi:hypothetical protein
MEQFDELLARISEAAGKLAPIPALEALSRARPLAPVLPLEHLLHHLTTAKVHDTYFPFIRFGCMHAARVAAAWAILTRSRARVGVLQDLVGFLTVACECMCVRKDEAIAMFGR